MITDVGRYDPYVEGRNRLLRGRDWFELLDLASN